MVAAAPVSSPLPLHAESPIYLPGSVELHEYTLSPSAANAPAPEDEFAAAALPSPSAVAADAAAEIEKPSAAAAAAGLISDEPNSGDRPTAMLHTIVVQQQQHMQQQQEQQQQQQEQQQQQQQHERFDSSTGAVAAEEGTRTLKVKRVDTNKKYLVSEAEEVNETAHMQAS